MFNRKVVKILHIAAVVIVSLVFAGSARAWPCVFDSNTFPVASSRYESLNPATYDGGVIQVEMVSLSLVCRDPVNTLSPLQLTDGLYRVDSFFDVFTELSVDGGDPTGTFATEIVSMSLQGTVAGIPIMIRECPHRASTGRHTITELGGGGQYEIDSFFDVRLIPCLSDRGIPPQVRVRKSGCV
jgi:hypothetical protein